MLFGLVFAFLILFLDRNRVSTATDVSNHDLSKQGHVPSRSREKNDEHVINHYHQKKDKIPILHNHNLAAMDLLQRGLSFLDSVQNPANCSGHSYMVTPIGIPGGFASQFQLTASIWMRMLAETEFTMPILIQGKLIGYSEGQECSKYDYSWTCYFLPSSRCEKELLATGKRVTQTWKPTSNENSMPEEFRAAGFFTWWGIIQSYLFRFQPYIENFILSSTHKMMNGRSFPHGLPMIGVHVRHGDKHVDQWKEFTLQEELQSMTDSIDCEVTANYTLTIPHSSSSSSTVNNERAIQKFCFYRLNFSEEYSSLILWRALHNQTIILRKKDLSHYINVFQQQKTSELYNELRDRIVSAKDLMHLKKTYIAVLSLATNISTTSSSFTHDNNSSTLKSHRLESKNNLLETNYYHQHHLDPFYYSRVHDYNITAIMNAHVLDHNYPIKRDYPFRAVDHDHRHFAAGIISEEDWKRLVRDLLDEEYVIPIDLFIASDDATVIQHAKQQQYFVNKEGVSQQTHGNAMISIVTKHHESSFEASLQIFADIFLLSQCSTLIGAAASQVFRMAVGMSKAKGFLSYVKALDYSQMKKIQQMSRKYNLPCPEEFHS